jgi:hypothetical protein
MSNIKNFETPADYQSFIGGEMVKPNVSYVKETNEVHYNPRFAIKFEEGNYYVEEANYLKEIYNILVESNNTNDIELQYQDIKNHINNNPEYKSYFEYLLKLLIYDEDGTLENRRITYLPNGFYDDGFFVVFVQGKQICLVENHEYYGYCETPAL